MTRVILAVAVCCVKAADGTPLVVHNIGRGAKEENSLFAFRITGHYRINKR